MNRYLIYFSYIGTQYRGVQKQLSKGVLLNPNETIQSVLEIALTNLQRKPLNQPIIYPASRTDSGVHALCTAAHVDLEFKTGQNEPLYGIMSSMNKYFFQHSHDIRIQGIHLVHPTFSARYSAIRKRYVYRFAVLKPDALPHTPTKKYLSPLPIVEKDRCYFISKPNFQISLAQEATSLFIGHKDFKAFIGRLKHLGDNISTERNIEELTLSKGSPFMRTQESNCYDFWDVTCTGKSFLYRQVRRIVSALIAIGQKKITVTDIERMLTNPTKDSWDNRISVVPGYGLYLANIYYNEEDLLHEAGNKEEIIADKYHS